MEVVESTFIILQLSSSFPPPRSPSTKMRRNESGINENTEGEGGEGGGRRDVLNARVYSRRGKRRKKGTVKKEKEERGERKRERV